MNSHWWVRLRKILIMVATVCTLGAEQKLGALADQQSSARAKGFSARDVSALLKIAKAVGTGDGHGWSMAAAEPPPVAEACCNSWQGFDFTGVLSVSPTNSSGSIACVNCVPSLNPNNIGMNFPEGRAFVGGPWSTTMTFHSTIAGPCVVAFLWVNLATGQPISGLASNIADCGPNNIWVWEFFNFTVPNVPGDTVAVGIIQASNATFDVDFERFQIQ